MQDALIDILRWRCKVEKGEKHYKRTFENISKDRQQKVLEVAINEFAQYGYAACNVSNIARNAGISIGSLYSYFASKEALFLTIVQNGVEEIKEAFETLLKDNGDFFKTLNNLFRISALSAHQNRKMVQIYLDATSQGQSSMSAIVAKQIEEIAFEFYYNLIENAKLNGSLRSDIDSRYAAFFIDNLAMMLQYSYSIDYYSERMKIFLGIESLNEIDIVVENLTEACKKMLK